MLSTISTQFIMACAPSGIFQIRHPYYHNPLGSCGHGMPCAYSIRSKLSFSANQVFICLPCGIESVAPLISIQQWFTWRDGRKRKCLTGLSRVILYCPEDTLFSSQKISVKMLNEKTAGLCDITKIMDCWMRNIE